MSDELTVAQQIAAAVAASEKGLLAKNKTLLQEAKDAKAQSKQFDGVDLTQLQKDAAAYNKAKKTKDEDEGNYKKLYDAQSIQHKEALDIANNNSSSLIKTLNSERTTNSLTSALVKSHVEPALVKAATTILRDQVAINDDGKAMVGDKTVSEFVKEWSTGDEGRYFVTNANSGGGASGPGGKSSADAPLFDPNSSKFSVTKQAQIYKQDPDLYNTLKKAAPAKRLPGQE